MKTAIVTDTNSSISAKEAQERGIYLIPMPFFVDGETYLEGEDCTPETFFQRMKAGAEISTSQPAPEEITSLWDTLLKTHDAVLHFPMSSGLSGSCHTAKALAQEYGGRVLVVDDRRISVTLAQSIRNAQVLLAQGKSGGGAGCVQRLHRGDHLGVSAEKRPGDCGGRCDGGGAPY